MFTIAIDASRAAGEQKTGVGWYAYHLLAHLKDVIPDDVGVVLYSDRPLPAELRPWPQNWEERVLPWPPSRADSRQPIADSSRWPMWSQLRLAWQGLRDRPDILFIPAHVIPKMLTRRKWYLVPWPKRYLVPFPRLVTTIHDIAFKEFPDAYARRERWYADHATRLAVRHADRIIVPTYAVARDLERWYGCDPGKIAVIHHGITPLVISTERVARASGEISDRLPGDLSDSLRPTRDDERLMLYVGRLEHKKNVVRMIEAFDRIASRYPKARLVLAGSPGHGVEDVRVAIAHSPFRDRILTPGWISEEKRSHLLSRASVFLYPTLAEGFGMPILEALAAGVPVVTTRGHAHEEVAGNAALLVNPLDTDAIADALATLLEHPDRRANLVHRGQQRAAQFTWEQSAQATWGELQSVLSA
ncbi:glycosyltransferase family 4 protein [Candidatus Uhrbacteria bacterium]|nr:glycosyltransferase family 4 protein [Candidatus Uhrbacteria bacterium]